MSNKTITNIFAVISLVMAGLISNFLFSSTPVFADNTISLTVSSNSVVLNLVPISTSGTFTKSPALDISVTLSGTGGYTLGIYSATSGADSTKLINTIDNTKSFTSISSAVSESDFSNSSNTQYNNQWGYLPSKYNSSNNTSFRPAPTETGDILDQTSGTNETGTYTLAIGARANKETTVGSYTGTYVITAIANQTCNSLATTISDALCMQDISGDNPNADAIINSMEEGRQYVLKDNRDWKEYYVAKMKDGRVWMTQNLDLDLEAVPTNVATLTHANTDLGWTTLDTSATWTPSTTTATTASGYGANTNTAPASFDYGDIYRYTSTTGVTTSYSTKTACETDHNDNTCPHYHVGNYYNWSAAVASNDTSSLATNYTTAPDSICPAGWRLPAGTTSATSTDPGYYSEINHTWINEELAKNYITSTDTATYNPNNTTGWNNIRNNPMFMITAGYKNGTSTVSGIGSYGYYWTNTVYSNTNAYAPYISNTGLYPAYYFLRGRGLSIRCVARQVDTGSTIITFDKNANDATGTTGTNNTQSISANTFANLVANGFSRTGYAFNSWNTEPNGSGTSYIDTAQIYAKVGPSTRSITLYAQWDKVYTITFNVGANATSIYFDGTTYTNGQITQAIENEEYQISGIFPTKYGLNSWSATAGTFANISAPTTTYTVTSDATITVTGKEATINISSLSVPTDPVSNNCKDEAVTPQLVYDPRDNEAYYVARLCDGNIWMLDNLRLDLNNSTTINNLSSTNTNATDTQLTYLKNGGGTTSDQYPTSGLSGSEWTSSESFSAPRIASRFKNDIAPTTFGLGSGKVGVYYNYCATSAGTYCWGNGNSSTGTPTTDPVISSHYDIEGDICPKDWHLPTYNEDFSLLYSAYSGGGTLGGETTLTQPIASNTALSIPLSGAMLNGGTQNGIGSFNQLWASTWYAAISNSYNRFSSATSVVNNNQLTRQGGASVRCVFGGRITVSFDKNANDATGTMNSQTVTGGTWLRINNGFTRTGYTLNSWNTEPDGSGTSYTDIYNPENNVTGNITLYAQWDKVYTITFNVGSGATGIYFDGTTYTNGQTVIAKENHEYQISGVFPTKYGLNSWSATAGSFANTSAHTTTYTVANNATITVTGKQATTSISSLTVPTNPVSSNCKNEAVVPQLVYDPRDNEAYYVARLCDGNIWMLDNLRLDLTNSTVINSLSSTNTNATNTQLNYLKNGGGTTSDQYPTAGLSDSEWTSGNSYSVPQAAARFKDDITPVALGLGTGKVGVYYNYCATSAGTYCWGNNTSYAGSPSSDPNTSSYRDIEGDICPAGWHLPNFTGEFNALYSAYSDGGTLGGQTLLTQGAAHSTALSTTLSGYLSNGSSQLDFDTYGNFWSSTWLGISYMRYQEVSTTSVHYSTFNRYYGRSIRCVLGSV